MLKTRAYVNWTDARQVKSFLEKNFSQRLAKKDPKLYVAICKIYDHHPDIINMLLEQIPKLGYYKDYFYILAIAQNTKLVDKIYDLILCQVKSDIANLELGREISTLGKWLPREKSKLAVKTNFIKRFTKELYPEIKKITLRFATYRKLKTKLDAKLGLIEINVCAGQLASIDFSKASHNSLIKFKSKIESDPVANANMISYQEGLLQKMSLRQLVDTHTSKHIPVQLIDNAYRLKSENFFLQRFDGVDLSNAICVIDLSNDTFQTHNQHIAYGVAMHVMANSKLNPCVYVGSKPISLTGSFSSNINLLMKNIGPCKFDLDKIVSGNKIILVTAKSIEVINKDVMKVDLLQIEKEVCFHKKSNKRMIREITSKIVIKRNRRGVWNRSSFVVILLIVVIAGGFGWMMF
jgi:hypothetical protein